MFGFALAMAVASLIAFLIVLVLVLRFFGALAGGSRAGNHLPEDSGAQTVAPDFKRFDLSLRRKD